MKFLKLIVTLLLLGAFVTTLGFAGKKPPANQTGEEQILSASLKQSREQLTPEMRKLLAPDDPTPVVSEPTYSGGFYRKPEEISLKAKYLAPFAGPMSG